MANQRHTCNTEALEQGMGIQRKLLKRILLRCGFTGFAKADLIRRDDPIAVQEEEAHRPFPGCTAKIFAM